MDISAIQIVIVLVIALLVFGPKRLPELGRQVGRGLREAKRQMNEVTSDLTSIRDEVHDVAQPSRREGEGQRGVVAATAQRDEDDDELLEGVVVDGADAPLPDAPTPPQG
jgi:sec-independent protein translocase protein TatA